MAHPPIAAQLATIRNIHRPPSTTRTRYGSCYRLGCDCHLFVVKSSKDHSICTCNHGVRSHALDPADNVDSKPATMGTLSEDQVSVRFYESASVEARVCKGLGGGVGVGEGECDGSVTLPSFPYHPIILTAR